MPRNVPDALATDLAKNATTLCYLLKIKPRLAPLFGVCSLNDDVTYDDGSGDGAVTYVARSGFTPMDVQTASNLSVDNSQASGLLSEFPAEGVTEDGINRGDYDGAPFWMYLVNYEALAHGHALIAAGSVGQSKMLDGMTCMLELRSKTDILKQNSLIELTSITDRARLGDERNKLPLAWFDAWVTAVGAEADRTFTIAPLPLLDSSGDPMLDSSGDPIYGEVDSSGAPILDSSGDRILPPHVVLDSGGAHFDFADSYFVPGLVHWDSGASDARENEIESYAVGVVTLSIPTRVDVQVGDRLRIRADYDGSWDSAKTLGCELDFRGEPFLPRANGTDLQSPTPSAG